MDLAQGDHLIVNLTAGSEYQLDLSTKKPALWTWLELPKAGLSYSDNFFHLRPGKTHRVHIKTNKDLEAKEIKKKIIIRSLIDTY